MKDQPLPLRRASQLLDRLEQTLGKPGDLQSTLEHILQTAQTSFESDGCMLVTINPITGLFMDALTLVGDGQARSIQTPRPRPQEVTKEILRQGLLLVENLEQNPGYHTHFTRDEGFQAFAGLALREKYSQKALGALYLHFHEPQHFSPTECELMQFFAEQTSYILQETWLVQRHQEVARIGQEINQELSTVEALFQKLQEHVNGILDTSYMFQLAVCHTQTNTVDIYLREQGQIQISHALPIKVLDRETIETGDTIFVPDLSTETWQLPFQYTSSLQRKPRGSLIFVPLTLRGSILGALSIHHPQAQIYNQEDQFILELLANQIALALHNIRLYDSLTLLNATGQVLTQQLESEQVIQAIVDQICQITQADNVILYPYESTQKRFTLPPRVGGVLLDQTPLHTRSLRPNDIAVKALEYNQPIFARDHRMIYTILRGDLQPDEFNFQQREKLSSAVLLPLKVSDVAVGVLFINYRLPQDFDPPQQFLIEGLAHYAAIALKNAQAYYLVMQRRIRELEILQEIDRELSQPIQLNEVLDTILRLGHEHVPAEEASLLLYDPHTRMLEPRAFRSRHREGSRAIPISLDESKGITAWAVARKASVLVSNVHKAPWNDRYVQASPDIVSELDVPMFHEGEVVGVLNFESTREGAFGYDEELFLNSLAGQAVLAINKSQAYEREKRLAQESRVLYEIGREITSQLDLNDVFNLILDKALELTNSTTGTLMLSENNLLWMAAERGVTMDNKHQSHDLSQGVVGYVARNKQPINIDPSQLPWSEIFLSYIPGSRSELAVPMMVGEELLGVLNVESKEPNNFHENDERLLKALADLACIALQNARAYQSEKRLADENQVLYDVSREISSQFDSENVFHLILEKALDLTNALTGSLYLYDPDLQDLHRMAEYDVQRVAKEGKKRQKLDTGIVGYAATHKVVCNVPDTAQSPWREIFIERVPGVRSELAVPMLEGNDLRGVLNVESRDPDHFSESDIRLLQGLAALAVIAQQNSERYKLAELETQQFKLLWDASRELGRIVEWSQLERAYDRVVQIAEEHSQCYITLRKYDESQEILTLIRTTAKSAQLHSTSTLDEGLNGQVARERQTRVIYDTQAPPEDVQIKLADPLIRSLAITPIHFKDRYYGNLSLGHERVGRFRDTDIHFLEFLATQLASTIYRLETVKARQELEQMSSIGQSAFEVTHRLDNDLGLIGLYINDIQSELDDLNVSNEVIEQRLNNISQSAQAVLSFSRDLKKELAKLSDKDEKGVPGILEPRALLKEALGSVRVPPSIQVTLTVEEDIVEARAVHSQIADILHNLVTNALQAMPEGGCLTLAAHKSGHFIALNVTDTGAGIAQQKQGQIFELFFSTKGSSGFGLWSARRNALKNHGDLKMKSVPGVGTTFTLLLPRADGGIM